MIVNWVNYNCFYLFFMLSDFFLFHRRFSPVLIPNDGVAAKVFHFGINGIVPDTFSPW